MGDRSRRRTFQVRPLATSGAGSIFGAPRKVRLLEATWVLMLPNFYEGFGFRLRNYILGLLVSIPGAGDFFS